MLGCYHYMPDFAWISLSYTKAIDKKQIYLFFIKNVQSLCVKYSSFCPLDQQPKSVHLCLSKLCDRSMPSTCFVSFNPLIFENFVHCILVVFTVWTPTRSIPQLSYSFYVLFYLIFLNKGSLMCDRALESGQLTRVSTLTENSLSLSQQLSIAPWLVCVCGGGGAGLRACLSTSCLDLVWLEIAWVLCMISQQNHILWKTIL